MSLYLHASGSARVARGGSWRSAPQYARFAYRFYYAPDIRYYFLGVRLIRRCP